MTLLATILFGALGTWVLVKVKRSQQDFLVVCFSFLLILGWNWTLLIRLPQIIKQDTIQHLSPTNAALLTLITLTLSIICICASVLKTRYLKRVFNQSGSNRFNTWFLFSASDFLTTFVAFAIALAVVPQLFYSFYRTIIPGLPVQWVFAPVSFTHSLHLLAVNQAETLSTLSAGLLLSTLLLTTCWSWLLLCPIFSDQDSDRN